MCLAPVDAQRQTLDDVLAAYVGGDFEVIQRTFVKSIDIQERLRLDKPRELDRWLGQWNRAKALLLLEFARISATRAPQYVPVLVGAGRRYLATARDTGLASARTTDFVRAWHRAAIGLLQGSTDPARVEEHVVDLARGGGGPDGRVLLAHAVAQERRCWVGRPSLEQPALRIDALLAAAGAQIPDDPAGPYRSDREVTLAKHSVCLQQAISRFETAAGIDEAATEARVRGGWTLLQDGRPGEAMEWLDAVRPHDDRPLEYWHGLVRGRVLEALGRSGDAVNAYRAILALYPRAQSASLGLTISLMHLDRTTEADEIARSVREGRVVVPDPWRTYYFGDQRFAGQWIDSLRTAVR